MSSCLPFPPHKPKLTKKPYPWPWRILLHLKSFLGQLTHKTPLRFP